MSNPKFLNVEKKVPYNIRLPQRLIDKYNAYSELTGNTTTNIINNILNEFIKDKVVMNDYLDNIAGITVKIPVNIEQKNELTLNDETDYYFNLTSEKTIKEHIIDVEKYDSLAELFEIKKIPNNLDIYINNSYAANKKNLLINSKSIHSGIELFVYPNIVESLFYNGKKNSFVNCLYCLYFEINKNYAVNMYIINYIKAIDLLSASGNEYYKNLIIACATELELIDENAFKYIDFLRDNWDYDTIDDYTEYISSLKNKVSKIADKYNSNNIIKFGADIFSRLAIKEIKDKETGFLDEIIDELIDKKFEIAIDERLNDIITKKIDEIFDDKIGEMKELTAD